MFVLMASNTSLLLGLDDSVRSDGKTLSLLVCRRAYYNYTCIRAILIHKYNTNILKIQLYSTVVYMHLLFGAAGSMLSESAAGAVKTTLTVSYSLVKMAFYNKNVL